MDIFSTDFSGLMRWIPSGKTSPVTLPNSVKTPTWPVGMDVVDVNSRMSSATTPTTFRNLDFNAPRFGMTGFPPPKLNSTLAMNSSVRYLGFAFGAFLICHLTSRGGRTATVPPYLVVFSLDTTDERQHNARH